jgi:hypothetical protein
METKAFETGIGCRTRRAGGMKDSVGRRGKTLAAGLLLGLVAWQPASGEDIYKCRYKGGVAYTSEPTLPSCRLIHIDVRQPSPEALAQLDYDRQQRAIKEIEDEKRTQARQLVRLRQLEVEAALRLARAAEIQAQASLNCPQYAVPLIYSSSPIYPGTYYAPVYFSSYSDPYRMRQDGHYQMTFPVFEYGVDLPDR